MSKSVIAYTDDVKVWQDLARAIILKAVRDYRSWPKRVKRCKPENRPAYEAEREELCKFFKSDMFAKLCDTDGENLLKKIEREENY